MRGSNHDQKNGSRFCERNLKIFIYDATFMLFFDDLMMRGGSTHRHRLGDRPFVLRSPVGRLEVYGRYCEFMLRDARICSPSARTDFSKIKTKKS